MSLLSSIILPQLEKEIIALEPQIGQFVLAQLKSVTADIMHWIETKGEAAALAKPNTTLGV